MVTRTETATGDGMAGPLPQPRLSAWFSRQYATFKKEIASVAAGAWSASLLCGNVAEVTTLTVSGTGAVAGSASAFVCSPVDVIRVRLQVQGAGWAGRGAVVHPGPRIVR